MLRDAPKRMSLALIAVLLAGSIATASAQPQSEEPRGAPPATPPPPRDAQSAPAAPARGCQTQWGVCQLACCVQPGAPCRCRDAKGNVLPGYAVDFFRPSR